LERLGSEDENPQGVVVPNDDDDDCDDDDERTAKLKLNLE